MGSQESETTLQLNNNSQSSDSADLGQGLQHALETSSQVVLLLMLRGTHSEPRVSVQVLAPPGGWGLLVQSQPHPSRRLLLLPLLLKVSKYF